MSSSKFPIREWYLDRDFPEIKVSNALILLHFDQYSRDAAQALCDEHNSLTDRLKAARVALKKELKHVSDCRDAAFSNMEGADGDAFKYWEKWYVENCDRAKGILEALKDMEDIKI